MIHESLRTCELANLRACELESLRTWELANLRACELDSLRTWQLANLRACELDNVRTESLQTWELRTWEPSNLRACELESLRTWELVNLRSNNHTNQLNLIQQNAEWTGRTTNAIANNINFSENGRPLVAQIHLSMIPEHNQCDAEKAG